MTSAPPLVLAFDLDGTLFDTAHGVDYEDADSVRNACTPHEFACSLVARLAKAGNQIVYITGRGDGIRAVTLEQIAKAELPGAALYMQPRWAGFDHMRQWKANTLRAVRADVYVGDHIADKEAADLARVHFIHANDFRLGNLHVAKVPAPTPEVA